MPLLLLQSWVSLFLGLFLVWGSLSAPGIAATTLPLTHLQVPQREQSMEPALARSLIQQAADAWLTGDAKAFAALFTPDGEFVVPGDQYIGRSAIQRVAAEFAAGHASVQIEIRRILVAGDQAVVEWYWQDRDDRTGKITQAEDAIVVDFQGNYIRRWREYIDTQSLSSF